MQEGNNGSGSRRSIGMGKHMRSGKRFGCGGSSVEALEAAIFAGADKSDLGATLENRIEGIQNNAQEIDSVRSLKTFWGLVVLSPREPRYCHNTIRFQCAPSLSVEHSFAAVINTQYLECVSRKGPDSVSITICNCSLGLTRIQPSKSRCLAYWIRLCWRRNLYLSCARLTSSSGCVRRLLRLVLNSIWNDRRAR